MIWKCRTTKPSVSEWSEIEAPTFKEAANSLHEENLWKLPRLVYQHHTDDGKMVKIHFAIVEVEGHGEWVSRIFEYNLWRGGGVPSQRPKITLQSIATTLGYTHDPNTLVDETSWEFEETMDEAARR